MGRPCCAVCVQVGVVLVHLRREIQRRVDAVFRDLVDQCPDLRAVTLSLRVPPLLPLLVPLDIPAVKKHQRTDRRGACLSAKVRIKWRKDQVSLTIHPSIRVLGAIACMNTP